MFLSEDIEQIKRDIRDIRNDIEKIKGDTGSLNRITVIINADIIEDDIKKLIKDSARRAAILHITKDIKRLDDIAREMNIPVPNVYRYLNPFLEKNYIHGYKKNRRVYYKRAELVDLISYEKIPEIAELLEKWKSSIGDSDTHF